MTPGHDELLDLCAGYAAGALDDEGRGRLERHLDTGCEECERALLELGDAAVLLASSAGTIAPDPALKRRVLEKVAAGGQSARESGRVVSWPRARARRVVSLPIAATGWAAAAVLVAVSVTQLRMTAGLKERLDEVQSANSRIENQLQEETQWTASMASPAARMAILEPTPAGAERMAGWALYDPMTRRAVIVVDNLKLEPGHDYELWAIRGAGPRSLGVIEVTPSGRAFVRLPEVSDPDLAAFAISFEAAGGSPSKTAPSGPVVMAGGLGL